MSTNQRFVAHIDILGMREMVRRDPEMAWQVLSGLAKVRDHVNNLHIEKIETAEKHALAQKVFSVMFSDTIVLFTKTESNDDLQAILIAAGEILHKAMCSFVPVRIGVSQGQFFFNIEESMYAGPALIKAYEIGESAQWIGIVTTEEILEQALAAKFMVGKEDLVIRASIPTERGFIAGCALNWVSAYRHDFKVKPPISAELFYSQFEHAFGPLSELPEKERRKYENTTLFVNECLSRT
jgi:hypothetical protein